MKTLYNNKRYATIRKQFINIINNIIENYMTINIILCKYKMHLMFKIIILKQFQFIRCYM